MGLNDVAQALGLPGKLGGHGSEVDAMRTTQRPPQNP
jgi:hypothetical protein